jgi:hypothetical protein
VLLVGELPRSERVALAERGAVITGAADTPAAFELLASTDFDVVVVNPLATGNGQDLVTAMKEGDDAHEHTVATLYGSRGAAPFLLGARIPNQETLDAARRRHRKTPFVVLTRDRGDWYELVGVSLDVSVMQSRRVLPLATAILTVSVTTLLGTSGAMA